MQCTHCKRLIAHGEPYCTTRSVVEVDNGTGEPVILDSVAIIVRCARYPCLMFAQVQMHPCLEKYNVNYNPPLPY